MGGSSYHRNLHISPGYVLVLRQLLYKHWVLKNEFIKWEGACRIITSRYRTFLVPFFVDCCLGYSGFPVKAQTKDSTNTLSDTVNLLSESSYLFIHWLASGKAAFVSVTRIVKKKYFKCLQAMTSFCFTYLLGHDFNTCSQHSGSFFFLSLYLITEMQM